MSAYRGKKFQFLSVFLCSWLVACMVPVFAEEDGAVHVSTASELQSAIKKAQAGTTIVLEDGTYDVKGGFKITGKNGTSSSPITIQAANQGQAVITGEAFFSIKKSSYIVLQGMSFTNTGNTAVSLDGSSHVQVSRNTFALTENGKALKWVYVYGVDSHHNLIDHNEFGPKHDLGNFITFGGTNTQISQYDTVEYNYFHDTGPRVENGLEAIRVGTSTVSMSDAFDTIQYNLFENCDGDPEFVSVKSGHNTVRYNTFRNSQGVLSARHGHGQSYYGNFFLGDGVKPGTGGIRLYANDHKVYNNYFEGLTGTGAASTLLIDGGDYDGGTDGDAPATSEELAKHWRVYRAQVVNNTIVNSATGISVGQSYQLAPVDSVVANNLVMNSKGTLYFEPKPGNTSFAGNIGYGSKLSNASHSSSEIQTIDPLLTTANGLQVLSDTSPAIDASVGDYFFITGDMDGQTRSGISDVGADESSNEAVINRPLTGADVGPKS
ncbi:polysaccharide lyase 6 family protein [Paenibacillus cremeus]|uniref:Lyase n=1 Tax=Paenibacillus cremeus TaxID=2163881 RepID=A0A559K5S7_9BACL|nr:polysaccharide lyase 6 family protein [Paenibacillus cremeus]TVY07456.1 lyase [Paenibacillus cremeus]